MARPLGTKNLVLKAGWRYSSRDLHASFDYEATIGTPVFAVRDGHILKTMQICRHRCQRLASSRQNDAEWVFTRSRVTPEVGVPTSGVQSMPHDMVANA